MVVCIFSRNEIISYVPKLKDRKKILGKGKRSVGGREEARVRVKWGMEMGQNGGKEGPFFMMRESYTSVLISVVQSVQQKGLNSTKLRDVIIRKNE